MKRQMHRILGLTWVVGALTLAFPCWTGAEVLATIDTPGRCPYRILDDPQSGAYWILLRWGGLSLLAEDENGDWSSTEFIIEPVYDAAGPDAQGRMYLSFADYGTSGVYVFDCASKTIEHTIVLGTDYLMRGLALSTDETRLYVLGWDWPRVGQWHSGYPESASHRDSGLLWEIDTSTFQVLRQGVVSALPKTIYCADNDVLLVYSNEVHWLFDIMPQSKAAMIDVVVTEPTLERVAQIQTIFSDSDYNCDFIDWSDQEPLVTMFASSLDWNQEDNYEYMSAIWIINTETNEVVETMKVFDERDVERYVNHGVLSDVHPGRLYVTVAGGPQGEGVYAIDKDTGEVIDRIFTGYGVRPEFVYEIPDGRLIVTCPHNEKILIIDPD